MAEQATFLGMGREDFQFGALYLGALGVGVKSVSQFLGGFERRDQLKTQSASLRRSAEIENINAGLAETEADINSKLQRRKWLKAIGENRAKIAAGGGDPYDLNTTPALGIVEDVGELAMEEELIRYGGDVRAWNHRTNADSLLTQASIYEDAAGSAVLSGILGGASSILEGTLVLGSNYFDVE